MGFISEFIKLTRFEHAGMLAFAVFIGEVVALKRLPEWSLLIVLSFLVPILSGLGAFSLNDFLDVETDRVNKKIDRPLVKGTISPSFALNFSIIAIVGSTIVAYFINIYAFLIALIFNVLAIAYNYRLKDLPLVGNAYIGLSMAIPFIFGNFVVSSEASLPVFAIALLGFIGGLAREIVKSIEDIKGDVAARDSKTLPVIVGERNAAIVAAILYTSFVLVTFLPFFLGLKLTNVALFLLLLANIVITYLIVGLLLFRNERFLQHAKNASLVAFAIGLIALFLGALAI